MHRCLCGLSFVLLLLPAVSRASDDEAFRQQVQAAIESAIPLIEKASATTADERTCFTCHGQAMPVFALVDCRRHGFDVDEENLTRQVEHTYAHLKRSKKKYEDGRGTGGQVDTAGWALWAIEAAGHEEASDDVLAAVMTYLCKKQSDERAWPCSSNRPPSEASDFATTYLALRGLEFFGHLGEEAAVDGAVEKARDWLEEAKAEDTEDRVFQLLCLPYVGLEDQSELLVASLLEQQRDDGGWAQLPDGESDAYATSTVLYALAQTDESLRESESFRRGVGYLLDEQLDDGSWYVASRSKPFQKYFETGFPHGTDQFISTTATCWAVIALLPELE